MSATASRQPPPPVTIAEFEAFLSTKGDDWRLYELLDGEIVMMTNPTNRHEAIVRNIGMRLEAAMYQRGCETFRGNTGLQASDDPAGLDKPRPDLMLRCGSSAADPLKIYITDALAVVEVLSPSTERTDIAFKLPFYLSLASTRHVVIVAQDERRVELWHRPDTETEWMRIVLPRDGEILRLGTVDFEIGIDEVYERVEVGKL